jgi:hypothetical protein
MRITGTQNDLYTRLQSAAASEQSAADFQATLDAAQRSASSSGTSPLTTGAAASVEAASAGQPMTAAQKLEEFLRKTPAEHMRDAILKEMGLTEEKLDAMPPEQRAAVEETIAEKIKERLLANDENAQASSQMAAASSSTSASTLMPILSYLMQEAKEVLT